MKRVLVTGATGFVGRQTLAPLAERGFEVHAVARPGGSERPPADGVRWVDADLLAPAGRAVIAEVRPTHLLHAAWHSGPDPYEAPENAQWARASADLLREFGAHGGERAVVTGSCAEYDWSHSRLSERDTPLRPRTAYGRAKVELHEAAGAIAAEAGFELAWARIFFLYGPHEREDRLVAHVTRSLLMGTPAPCTDGDQFRDFLHVADAGDALAALVASEAQGAVNIASGAPVSVRDLVGLVGRETGRPQLIKLGVLPRPPDDPRRLDADVTRLATEVAWGPRISLADGIADTVGFWRERLG